jgi:uncharacterized UPF0160 family protein/uncharacterized membrane protein YdjX (TVP38/TMEM64 family)
MKKYIAYGVTIVLVGVSFWFALDSRITGAFSRVVGDNSFESALALLAIFALSNIIAPISSLPLVPIAAAVFGPLTTVFLSIIGWTIGAIGAYLIGRYAGREILRRWFSLEKIERFERHLPRRAEFWSLVLLRMVLPVDVLSYAMGMCTTMRFVPYTIATIIGITPFAVIFSYGGAAIFSKNISAVIMFGMVGVCIFIVVVYSYKKFMSKKITIATHSGRFHPDDVCAVATLKLLLGEHVDVDIVRTRDADVIKSADYVVDVGGEYDPSSKRFDHHQKGGAGMRENGIPYAAFGLVWKEYGEKIAGSAKVAQIIDKKLVSFVDAMDNGTGTFTPVQADVYPYTISNVIFTSQPTWKEPKSQMDDIFRTQSAFAMGILAREIKIIADVEEGKETVKEVYERSEDKKLIIFEKNYPWYEVLAEFPEPLYVIEPAEEDISAVRWKVRAVQKPHTFENRKSLPTEWAGKMDKELQEITGVNDAVFCHNKLFLAVAESKEGALALARKALEN